MLLSSSFPRTLRLLSSPSLTHRIHQYPHRNPNFSLQSPKSPRLFVSRRLSCYYSNRSDDAKLEAIDGSGNFGGDRMSTEVGNPSLPVRIGMYRMSLGDQAFFLLAFIACTVRLSFLFRFFSKFDLCTCALMLIVTHLLINFRKVICYWNSCDFFPLEYEFHIHVY